jgi:hypothetical protein
MGAFCRRNNDPKAAKLGPFTPAFVTNGKICVRLHASSRRSGDQTTHAGKMADRCQKLTLKQHLVTFGLARNDAPKFGPWQGGGFL